MMKQRLLFLLAVPVLWGQTGQPSRTESYLGSLAPIARSIHQERGFPMAFANRGRLSPDEWRKQARAEVQRALSYAPKTTDLDVQVHSREKRDGYELRVISFASSPHYRVPGFLLLPTNAKPPYPGVVALHDHGGFFMHGKEKLVEMPGEHPALTDLKVRFYGGRSWAGELAKRGYAVLAIDAFFWGDRRLQYKDPPPDFIKAVGGLDPSTREYATALNTFLGQRAAEVHTWLAFSGTSWMGIVVHDERRSLDVLASLPEVDAKRLGCVGLSGGGYRSTYLTGMDPRIRASVITGWMTSLPSTLDIPYSVHSRLFDAFSAHFNLDHPDIASMGAPDAATFVQNCAQDRLFTRAGMDAAVQKIQAVYKDLGRPERFQAKYYDVPHQFNVEMQQDAFEWLDRWLKPAPAKAPPR